MRSICFLGIQVVVEGGRVVAVKINMIMAYFERKGCVQRVDDEKAISKNLPYKLHRTPNAQNTQQKLGVAFLYLDRENTNCSSCS